ncbi:hypothetical protein GCM10009092_43060 [Bowmanella denitrificans]|uniref:DUF3293 domain-containing protein n=1 Tax=Bowmanella denitrificans TaxID=366582 RepID=A0ABN0XVQ4_9ALTE
MSNSEQQQTTSRLWQLYQNTIFVLSERPVEAEQRCIVTACNPGGSVLSKSENTLLQGQLAGRLSRQGFRCSELIGAGADLKHQEPSYLIACNKLQGLELARHFKQNAFYWLDGEQVWLLPAMLEGYNAVALGNFRARCRGCEQPLVTN